MARMRLRRARASRSVWARSTSSIWRPTGTTGLSAVIGSWKIIAMVVARSCRRRRSLAASSSSPTSLMLPPVGASAPFCNRPITVSEVTDLPDPLSPTRHSVSRSRTCSEMPSMMRSSRDLLPRLTTRLSMSRTGLVMSTFSAVIPGRCVARDPESRDSGSGPSDHPGMTMSLRRSAPRNTVTCRPPAVSCGDRARRGRRRRSG